MQVSTAELAQTIVEQHGPTLDPGHAAEIVTDNYIVLDRKHPDHPDFLLAFDVAADRVTSGTGNNQTSQRVYIDHDSIRTYEREARLAIFMHEKAVELRKKYDDREATKIARILHTTSEIGWEDCLEQAKELLEMGVVFKNVPEIPATPGI